MDFFRCEAEREILVFGSGEGFFGSCIFAVFGQFGITFLSQIQL